MNWRAWAASIALHAAIAVALFNLTAANPSPERTVRWEVQMALTAPPPPPPPPLAPPEPPATPTPPAPVPQAPVQAPPPPPIVAKKVQPAPKLSAQRPKLPPVAAVKPPPKRNPLPQPRQPPPPLSERPVSNPRKPPPPSSTTAKASSRSSKPKTMEPFSDAPSRPSSQEFIDSPRSAFRETRSATTGHRSDAIPSADPRPARSSAPPAKPNPESGAANWQAALRAKLREMRVYPPIARRLGQEGTVTLLLEIGANGDLRGLTVRQSSGHTVLDQAAQQLARNAVAALRGQLSPPGESRLEIPIAYRLDR